MAAPTNNNPSVLFSAGPFPHEDIAQLGFQFLTVADAGRFSQVSKAWNAAMQRPGIWLTLFDVEKIPRIEGRVATAQEDLSFMLPRTYSAKKMACVGKFVGLVPMISEKAFEMFKTAIDAYESSKKFSETFSFIVEPIEIYRENNEALLNDLIANGDFDAKAVENKNPQENGLRIPYSLVNLKILAEHPLTNKGGAPVFAKLRTETLKQCSTIAKRVKLTLMRKEVPRESQNLTFSDQNELLNEKGHVLVPLCTRVYFDGLEIMNSNTRPMTYSITSDGINIGNDKYSFAVGGFPLGGAVVNVTTGGPIPLIGAAPGIPAEEVLRPSDIGSGQ
jgi:hypothetical protein